MSKVLVLHVTLVVEVTLLLAEVALLLAEVLVLLCQWWRYC